MKDYKKSISIGNSIYPLVCIGTYGRSYEELFELSRVTIMVIYGLILHIDMATRAS